MICVYSEIAELKKVLVHRPGRELKYVTPRRLEELLFAQMLDLPRAQSEHDSFTSILRQQGVEVVYLVDLLVETYESCDDNAKMWLIENWLKEAQPKAKSLERIKNFLIAQTDTEVMITYLMTGITKYDLQCDYPNEVLVDPMPNLYFTRDPFSSVGNGVTIHHMKYATRQRETLFSEFIFKFHPEYRQTKQFYRRDDKFTIEGGDIFPYNEKTLVIGVSERTLYESIEILARNIFENKESSFENIFAINVPKNPELMHLDTWLTMVDENKFIYSPNMIGDLKMWKVELENGTIKRKEIHGKINELLKVIINQEPVLIPVAGNSKQYDIDIETNFDATNFLTIRPGVVVGYDRNRKTIAALREAGVTVWEFNGDQLSLGMGSCRCMSMPLIRGKLIK